MVRPHIEDQDPDILPQILDIDDDTPRAIARHKKGLNLILIPNASNTFVSNDRTDDTDDTEDLNKIPYSSEGHKAKDGESDMYHVSDTESATVEYDKRKKEALELIDGIVNARINNIQRTDFLERKQMEDSDDSDGPKTVTVTAPPMSIRDDAKSQDESNNDCNKAMDNKLDYVFGPDSNGINGTELSKNSKNSSSNRTLKSDAQSDASHYSSISIIGAHFSTELIEPNIVRENDNDNDNDINNGNTRH